MKNKLFLFSDFNKSENREVLYFPFQNYIKLTEIELIYRTQSNFNDRHKTTTSKDAYNLFRNNWDENLLSNFKLSEEQTLQNHIFFR